MARARAGGGGLGNESLAAVISWRICFIRLAPRSRNDAAQPYARPKQAPFQGVPILRRRARDLPLNHLAGIASSMVEVEAAFSAIGAPLCNGTKALVLFRARLQGAKR